MNAITADARFWDGVARKYAAARIRDEAGYERTVARTGQLLDHQTVALEIGCGTGTTALRLAPGVARIVATDLSGEMIAIAREKAAAAGCRNVEFVVSGAADAPGADGSFGAVLAFNVLHLVADRSAALARVRNVLRPGGLLITKTPCIRELNVLIRAAIPVAQWFGKAPHVDSFAAADLERDITEAGFAIVERARHGSWRKDPRIFLVACRP
jgi:ubiquinone/menaquinone biosynthesis C-methylase UbiE